MGAKERQPRPGLCCATPLVVPRDSNGDGTYDLHCAQVSHFSLYAYTLIGGEKDTDNDFFPDLVDTCPTVSNTLTQNQDADGDRVGDICDNCPNVFNPDQQDANSNGIGDRCDPSTPPITSHAVPVPPVAAGLLGCALLGLGLNVVARARRRDQERPS